MFGNSQMTDEEVFWFFKLVIYFKLLIASRRN